MYVHNIRQGFRYELTFFEGFLLSKSYKNPIKKFIYIDFLGEYWINLILLSFQCDYVQYF